MIRGIARIKSKNLDGLLFRLIDLSSRSGSLNNFEKLKTMSIYILGKFSEEQSMAEKMAKTNILNELEKLTKKNSDAQKILERVKNFPLQSSDTEKKQKECFTCGETEGHLMLCSKCRNVHYCSRDCQVANWSEHKKICE